MIIDVTMLDSPPKLSEILSDVFFYVLRSLRTPSVMIPDASATKSTLMDESILLTPRAAGAWDFGERLLDEKVPSMSTD